MNNNNLQQRYELYTTDDFKVWQTLYDRQMNYLQMHAARSYLDAIEAIAFNRHVIPHFGDTTARLQAATGWQLKVVPNLVPQDEFFEALSQRIFPATAWLRSYEQIDYIEEPDMFHDVFGHVPLLVNADYAAFMEGIGQLAMKWMHSPQAISLLGSMYWFTIEFGLMQEADELKLYGAGIMSSLAEANNALGTNSEKLGFDLVRMLHTDYRTDILQDKYFTITSFAQLYESLPAMDAALKAIVKDEVLITRVV